MYFEDFEIDRLMTTSNRTINEDDLETFIKLSGLYNPLFTSGEGAKAIGHADRLIPGPLQLSVAMGLAQQAGFFDQVVAVLQFDEMKFSKTVHPGDTLTLELKPLSKRPTSNPSRGLVILEYVLKNQDGQSTLAAKGTYLFRTRTG